jgi:hypothetical protein
MAGVVVSFQPVSQIKGKIMGKGNNSQKNDKKGMKPKSDKKKGTKADSKK